METQSENKSAETFGISAGEVRERPLHEAFGTKAVDSQGRQFYHVGADTYKEYLDRAKEMSDDIVDNGIPQLGEDEECYLGEGDEGHWVPLNPGRTEGTVLECCSVTACNASLWKFQDPPFNYMSWYAGDITRRHLSKLSYCLSRGCRHYGCTFGTMLGCDSGGWFLL
jgi:hypothetical protein